MARKKRRGEGSWAERKVAAADDRGDAVLAASVMAIRWRLEEAATRIVEVERVLSAVFLLARETHPEASSRS